MMDSVEDLRAVRLVQAHGLDLASANDRELTAILDGPGFPFFEGGGILGCILSETRCLVRLMLLADSDVPGRCLLVLCKRHALVPRLRKLERASNERRLLRLGLGMVVVWVIGIRR
jgi:hypothetical protein